MASLHIAFGLSAAGSLQQALAVDRPDDQVIAFTDDLSFGPIDSCDPRQRADWIAEHLQFEWWDEVALLEANFWSVVMDWLGERVAWFCRRSASEHANFLAFNARLGQHPFRVLDLTDAPLRFGPSSPRETSLRPTPAVALIPSDIIRSNKIVERSLVPSTAMRAADLDRWRQLQSDNAALRIIRERELVSAPITAFDEILLAFCSTDWTKMAWPIGHTLGALMEMGEHQVGDLVLASRMFAMMEAGTLEGRGELSSIRDSEVRLKP